MWLSTTYSIRARNCSAKRANEIPTGNATDPTRSQARRGSAGGAARTDTSLNRLPCRTPRQKSARSHAAKHFSSSSSPEGKGGAEASGRRCSRRDPAGRPDGTPGSAAAAPAPPAVPYHCARRIPSAAWLCSPAGTGRDGMNGTGWDGTGWGGRGGCARFEGDGRRRPDPRALIRGPAALRPPGPSVPVLTPSPSPPSFSPA